jgi:CubicO group peptidase (beta-lactamase class C family)
MEPVDPGVRQVATVEVDAPDSLLIGHSVTLTARALDAHGEVIGGKSFTWQSSDDECATVDEEGRVTARSEGDVTITATTEDKSGSAFIEVEPYRSSITAILDSLRTFQTLSGQTGELPALGGAIVTQDTVLALDAVGRRRASSSTPVTATDKFHLGSNTKAMTAGLVAKLVDQGLLSWDMRLQEALPDLAEEMRSEYRDCTIVDLLSHGARLPRDPQAGRGYQDPATAERREAVRWGITQPPATEEGGFSYSNLGYIVAGYIAERHADQVFEELMRERLFTPMGMASAGFGAMGTPGEEDQPWQHYTDDQGQLVEVPPGPHADNPPAYSPAGRAHMSLGDWAKYLQAVLKAERGESTLWSQASAVKLTSPYGPWGSQQGNDSIALGWLITRRHWPPGRILVHDGSNGKSYSSASVALDAGFAVMVVTNQGGYVARNVVASAKNRLVEFYRTGL